jgi:RNA 2',3'-cyclic 3'-phosphodiesterase
MPRLFTALEVATPVAERLAGLRGGLQGARWIDVENYHVTLRFLGDIDDRTACDAAAVLGGRPRPPLRVRVSGLDVFGGTRPRAIIARVEPDEDLMELQAEQERALRRIGLPPETRKFTPHITLSRLRDVSARAAADWLAANGGGASLIYEVDRVVLFSSRASTGGGPYIAEEVYPFGFEAEEDDEDAYDDARW